VQEPVTGYMAVSVIDLFETIRIKEYEFRAGIGSFAKRQHMLCN